METSLKLREVGPKHIQDSQLNTIKSDGHFTRICISLFYPSKHTHRHTHYGYNKPCCTPTTLSLYFRTAKPSPALSTVQLQLLKITSCLMTGCICLRVLSLYDHSTYPVIHNLPRYTTAMHQLMAAMTKCMENAL